MECFDCIDCSVRCFDPNAVAVLCPASMDCYTQVNCDSQFVRHCMVYDVFDCHAAPPIDAHRPDGSKQ
eukprot:scaffold138876_cov22-Tisochrysis_lutea.AAC.1